MSSKLSIVEQFVALDARAAFAATSAQIASSAASSASSENAAARHLADVGDTGLYPQPPYSEAFAQLAGQIDGWIDFSLTSIQPHAKLPSSKPAKGQHGDPAALQAALQVLDAHLSTRTFLVGQAVSLAEVVLICDLQQAIGQAADEKARHQHPHLHRWLHTMAELPQFKATLHRQQAAQNPNQAPKASSSLAAATLNGPQQAGDLAQPGSTTNARAVAAPRAKEKQPKAAGQPKGKPQAKTKQPQPAKAGPADDKKAKETKLGINVRKDEDFAEWYTQVCTVAEMISYYDVSGCYILRPWAYSVWESIMHWFDPQIKRLGVENACFPLFVTEDALTKEKDHVEGFAAEVAWVTRSGKSDLQRPIAIRPTSETVMYPYFAQWIRSWRDLPLKLNQWTNVVRWEFSNPTPFIRTREFLWQEGHTAYATKAEADEDVYRILDLYARVYTDLMAVPVTKGFKSKNEQFAGSAFSTSVEGFIEATGRGIQCATSHALGQNFSRMFGIEFEAKDKSSQLAWQNSWGLSTRTIGVMVMVHGDDKGLVMPPRVAPVQVIVIPIPNSKLSAEESGALHSKAEEFLALLEGAGIRCRSDTRDIYTPGWKYANWETKGVPVRLAIGHKDMQKQTVEIARRDTGEKQFVPWKSVLGHIQQLLERIQADMYSKALQRYKACREVAHTWDEFTAALGRKHMVLAPWCDEVEVEKQVKVDSSGFDAAGVAQMGAKTLCIPLEQPELEPGTKCFKTGKPAKNWALWGRSY